MSTRQMYKSGFVLFLVLLVISMLGFSCATSTSFDYTRDGLYEPGTMFAYPKIRPTWIDKGLYLENGNLYVVGHAVSEYSSTIADKKAKDDAYGKLIEYSGAKVEKISSSNTNFETTGVDGETTNSFSETVNENVTLYAEEQVSQVRILDSCRYAVEAPDVPTKFVSYVLIAVDKDVIDGVYEKNARFSEMIMNEVDRRICDSENSDDVDFYLQIKDFVSRFTM